MTEELFRDDAYLRHCQCRVTGVDERGIRLDRTVFYPQGGGQPGDQGTLTLADGRRIAIVDTRKDGGDIVHVPEPGTVPPQPGADAVTRIDWHRRHAHMRMHSCLHLLCSLVDAPVTGGSIATDRGRLDFDLPEPTIDKQTLTDGLNRLIEADPDITARWINTTELAAQPELVRTLSVKPPMDGDLVRLLDIDGVDLQPCGGTHVASCAEIGRVRVSKIEKKSRHNRRVTIVFEDE